MNLTEAPAHEEAATPEHPVGEHPVAENPVAEQPVAEQPVAEQPVAEQPVAAQAETAPDPRKEAARLAWQRLVDAKASNETISGRVLRAVKGGLMLDVTGYRAFLPATQSRPEKGQALESLVGSTIPLKVLDVDEKQKRLVVSHRRALGEERRVARAAVIDSLTIGKECEATVVRLADFGAFVDLGSGVDALIPLSELAFENVKAAGDVVAVGERLTVRIIRIDSAGKRIAASRKGALHDPWRDHAELLRPGTVVEGKVVSVDGRLEVEIAPNIVGSVSDRDADPADYTVGESVEVTVRFADHRNRRLRLTTAHAAAAHATSSGFAPLGVELNKKK